MKHAWPMLTMLALALSACSDQGAGQGAGERAAEAGKPASTTTAPADQPDADVPPATAPPGSLSSLPSAGAEAPAEGAIGYGGFGPAPFGADDEAVRMAWGKGIKADTPSEPGGCYYLFPQKRPQANGYGIGFMIEGDRFSRIDVDSADIVAPGGGRIGMSADEIRSRYAGRIEEQQHKYVEGGKYLRIKDSGGGSGVLLFVTDAAGKVTSWRVGVPPQVDYVEACS